MYVNCFFLYLFIKDAWKKIGLFKQSHMIFLNIASIYAAFAMFHFFRSQFLYIPVFVTIIFRLLSFSCVIRQRATDVFAMLVRVAFLLLMILRTHITQIHRSIKRKNKVSENYHDESLFFLFSLRYICDHKWRCGEGIDVWIQERLVITHVYARISWPNVCMRDREREQKETRIKNQFR